MKIGLLAMSGIRVRDEKLLGLGLTLPGFVDRSRVVASLPSLGLLYLAAVTPDAHEVIYVEAADGQEPRELYSCDLVAISSFSAQIFEAYAVADRLRSSGVTVALGGLHVSSLPEEAFAHADHVVAGEGELVWPQLLRAVERGEPGRIWRTDRLSVVPLATLPVPRYELLKGRPYNRFTVQTSRGCPWRCEFCASTVMLGKPYRKRPVSGVIRDLKVIQSLFPHPYIEFADDNTFVDTRWGKELCRELSPLRLKWFTETDVGVADDPELLDLMREAGCRQILIGLESPRPEALHGLELRSDFKARVADRYAEAIADVQARGITVNGCFILGLDHHDTSIFEQILDFVNTVSLYEVQITVLTPFPGTPLYARLEREGRLLAPGDWSRCTLFDVNYTPRRMSPDELREGLYWLSERLYSSSAIEARRRPFFAGLHAHEQRLEPILISDRRAA